MAQAKKKTAKKKAGKKKISKKKAAARKKVAKAANPVGRPPKYKTPEEMQAIINLYFLACKANRLNQNDKDGASLLIGLSDEQLLIINDIEDIVPTISGLAYILNMSRQALLDYQNKDQFLDTIKRAKQRVEVSLEQRLAGNAVVGTIFNLKNNFGWKDKIETDITSGGEPVKNEWHMHPVTTVPNG